MTTPGPSHARAVPPARPDHPNHPWIARTWITPSGCLVAEAAAGIDPVTVFRHASRLPHAIFFDSAVVDRPDAATAPAAPANDPPVRLGRHSFVAADPIRSWLVRRGGDWDECRQLVTNPLPLPLMQHFLGASRTPFQSYRSKPNRPLQIRRNRLSLLVPTRPSVGDDKCFYYAFLLVNCIIR